MATIAELVREAYSNWDDAKVLSRTGQELHDRNRLDLAREVLERALKLNPKDVDAWAHLGFANLRSFQPAQGLATLREAVRRTDSDLLRGTLAGFTDDAEERQALLAKIADSTAPAVRAAAASLRLSSGEAQAFDELRRIAEENPDDQDVGDTWLWTLLNARWRGTRKDLDLREVAVGLAEKRIAADPDRILPRWMKAQMLLAEQDWDGLRKATEEALEHHPDEETMMYLRGRALKEKGELDRALQCFARAIGMKPSYAGARAELGKTYEAQGKLDLAEEVFREIPRANPGFAGGPLGLALFLGRQGRWEEAESIFLETWPRLEAWQKARIKQQPDAAPLLARDRIKATVG